MHWALIGRKRPKRSPPRKPRAGTIERLLYDVAEKYVDMEEARLLRDRQMPLRNFKFVTRYSLQ